MSSEPGRSATVSATTASRSPACGRALSARPGSARTFGRSFGRWVRAAVTALGWRGKELVVGVHPESPCSVPAFLRPLVPIEPAAWQACCAEHDELYARGGTEADRLLADARFLVCMLTHEVEATWALRYFQAVRLYGRASFGTGRPMEWPSVDVWQAP